MNDRELLQQALDALNALTKELLACRDELAERGARPETPHKQKLWDSAFNTYTGMAIPTYEAIRARLAQNDFNPDWNAMAVMVEEQQRMAKRIEELETRLAQPEQKPVGKFAKFNDGIWKEVTDGSAGQPLYTAPLQRKPLTDKWVPVTQSLLNEQHPWLYQSMWIAMKGEVVVQGYYEWRQGRNPDRFITDLGDEWAFNADFVMPITKPTPPAIEAKLKEKNT